MKILFATNNAHKKKELEAILGIPLCIPSDADIPFNPAETGNTFCENAMIKARELKKLIGGKDDPVIADDSGLCVDALDGRPGIFSARYGDKEGIELTSLQKNHLLLEELGNNPNRSARFVCAMVLLFTDDRFTTVQETIEGEIVKNCELIRGEGGFGYDPVFYLPERHCTLAELSEKEKNAISHRGRAGRTISNIIKNGKIKI